MIIDFHTHMFPDRIAGTVIQKLQAQSRSKAFITPTADGLRKSMKEAGIDLSVILPVATNVHQPEKLNSVAAEINAHTDETGLLSLGAIHPDTANMRQELARCVELGLKGVKIHPAYQGVDIDDLRFLRLIDRANELGLLVITHAGWDIGIPGHNYVSPKQILRVMEEVHPDKFVAAHMGSWRCWDEVSELLAGLPLWIDTAFTYGTIVPAPENGLPEDDRWLLSDEEFVALVRKHGTDKVLFATDSPWSDQRHYVEYFKRFPFTPEEQNAILGDNAAKLLGLFCGALPHTPLTFEKV